MDIRDYVAILGRAKWKILGFVLFTILVAIIYTNLFAITRYSGEILLTTTINDQDQTQDFKYSNYYAEFSANNFSSTLEQWLQNPALVHAAYKDAGIDMLSDISIGRRLLGPISAKRDKRSNVKIRLSSKTSDNLQKLTIALLKIVNDQLTTYNTATGSNYMVLNQGLFIRTKEPNPVLNSILLGMLSLLISIVLAFFYEYITDKVSTPYHAREALETKNILSFTSHKLRSHQKKFLQTYVKKFQSKLAVIQCHTSASNKQLAKFLQTTVFSFDKHLDSIATIKKKDILVIVELGKTTNQELHQVAALFPDEEMEILLLN